MKPTIYLAGVLLAIGSAAYAQSTPTNDNGRAIDTSNRNASGMDGSTGRDDEANSTDPAAQPNVSASPNAKSDR